MFFFFFLNLKTYLKFKWIAVLASCMLSGTQNNHLTSARCLDRNTNRWWALGSLPPHTGACRSWACHESGFLVLLQKERSDRMSDCWGTSAEGNRGSLHSLPILKNFLEAEDDPEEVVQRGGWPVRGRHGEVDERFWPREAFPARAAQPPGWTIHPRDVEVPENSPSRVDCPSFGRRGSPRSPCLRWTAHPAGVGGGSLRSLCPRWTVHPAHVGVLEISLSWVDYTS